MQVIFLKQISYDHLGHLGPIRVDPDPQNTFLKALLTVQLDIDQISNCLF